MPDLRAARERLTEYAESLKENYRMEDGGWDDDTGYSQQEYADILLAARLFALMEAAPDPETLTLCAKWLESVGETHPHTHRVSASGAMWLRACAAFLRGDEGAARQTQDQCYCMDLAQDGRHCPNHPKEEDDAR